MNNRSLPVSSLPAFDVYRQTYSAAKQPLRRGICSPLSRHRRVVSFQETALRAVCPAHLSQGMAPDRGLGEGHTPVSAPDAPRDGHEEAGVAVGRPASRRPTSPDTDTRQPGDVHGVDPTILKEPLSIEGHSFTVRGVGVGLAIGLVLACTNISMGLQSGWISTMTMPASLMGFGFFRLVSRHLKFPFSPVENVLVQTVAGSMGIMPLGCGLVGVVPAMNFLLTKDENGPLNLDLWQLVIWSLGVCYFGVLFAVPLYVTLLPLIPL